jgi:hypothetical protein
LRPPPRPPTPSEWQRRKQAAAERRDALRLAELEVEQRRDAVRLAELAAEQRARDQAMRERDQQWRAVDRINQQRQSELRYAAQVRAAQQRAAYFDDLQAHVDQLIRTSAPALEPEPQVVYVSEEEGTGRLGYSDFNPKLMANALRWR